MWCYLGYTRGYIMIKEENGSSSSSNVQVGRIRPRRKAASNLQVINYVLINDIRPAITYLLDWPYARYDIYMCVCVCFPITARISCPDNQ